MYYVLQDKTLGIHWLFFLPQYILYCWMICKTVNKVHTVHVYNYKQDDY